MAQQDDAFDDADVGPQEEGLPRHERAYLIPAHDAKGHSTRLWCRAMPALGRLVADIVATRKFPFRTPGDLVRFAVYRQARELAADAGVFSNIAQIDSLIAALHDEEYHLQFTEFFNLLERVVNRFVVDGSPAEARRVVAEARANLARMEDGYWKTRYEDDLLRRFGAYLEGDDSSRGKWGTEDHQRG